MIWRIARRKHNVVLVFGKQAKVLREMLDSAVVPDRTALEKEADVSYRITCNNGNQRTLINP